MRPSATINPLSRKALPPRCLKMAGPTCSRRNSNPIRYGHDQAGLLGLLSGVIEIWPCSAPQGRPAMPTSTVSHLDLHHRSAQIGACATAPRCRLRQVRVRFPCATGDVR